MSPAERRFPGRAAAPGLARGALVRLAAAAAAPAEPAASTPAHEERALITAMAQARAELERLAAAAGDVGAEVLAFQIELLADDALIETARAAIADGAPAARAWSDDLSAEIASYEAADDDYFRARASDLTDLRDRVLRALGGAGTSAGATLPRGAILLADDLTPSGFLEIDWRSVAGAALIGGSASSHVAMLARARGVPLVVALGATVEPAPEAILDGDTGALIAAPAASTRADYRHRIEQAARLDARAQAFRDRPAATFAGERVEVMVNVDDPTAIDDSMLLASDGVGLMRTEFLFLGHDRLPDEDQQYSVYRTLLDRLDGRPATIRTLDVGGDKVLAGVTLPAEANPFLGVRGIRLCLDRPELFRPQIRALLRAAVDRQLKVMVPMVTVAAELEEARVLFDQCLAALRAAGVDAAMPAIGMMVETPAAAIAIDTLDAAAFYSIGSNDLTQYVMAAARDAGGRVARLNDPNHPAVLKLIGQVIAHGRHAGRAVSLCGDLASDPGATRRLLELGLRQFSVAPPVLGRIKLAIAESAEVADT